MQGPDRPLEMEAVGQLDMQMSGILIDTRTNRQPHRDVYSVDIRIIDQVCRHIWGSVS